MKTSILPSEIQALLHYALHAPAQLSFSDKSYHSTEDKNFNPEGSRGFQKLIDGIHFSKRFILSYQLVLVALLLVFTVIHWTSRLRAWRRRRERRLEMNKTILGKGSLINENLVVKGGGIAEIRSTGSSSSSSTLGGDVEYPALERSDEQTPLLSTGGKFKQNSTQRWKFYNRIKSWLVYQPRPIPIVNKTLPSNGTSLVITAFLGLQIFYALFNVPFSLSTLFVFADRTSLLFVANLPLLYLFAAKNQPLKILTGYSYEALNIFHRRLGEVMCLLALLHSVGMIGVWYTILRPAGIMLINFLLIKMILLGIGAFIAYELIYFTSLSSFRQRWYELFLALHVFLQAAALVLVWFHHHGSRPYVGVALGIFLIDRLIYRMWIKIATLPASLEVMSDKQTVSLQVTVPLNKQSYFSTFTANITKGWNATSHIFLTIPSLSPKHLFQAHPFTIASKAPSTSSSTEQKEQANLTLLIRAQSGFSSDLLRHAQIHSTLPVRLDGPYGSHSALHTLHDSTHAILIAGGSGIAVTWPLVWSVLDTFSSRSSSRKDLESHHPAALSSGSSPITFYWIVRERSHISWLDKNEIQEVVERGVKVRIEGPTAECGHPDVQEFINEEVNALGAEAGRIGVVVSGPDGLNRGVRNACAGLIRRGMDVRVEVEKFGW